MTSAETLDGATICIARDRDGWDGVLLNAEKERLLWSCGHAHKDSITARLDALLCVATEIHRRAREESRREKARIAKRFGVSSALPGSEEKE